MYLLKFKKNLVEKVWGGRGFQKTLGFDLPTDELYGESWEVSCHPAGMSYVENGELEGKSLEEIFVKYGKDLVGEEIIEKYGDKFPLLIKYLDINDKLSVQVHPSDEYALRVEKEFGKSEVWYVMEASSDAKLILGLKNDVTPEIYKEKVDKKDFTGLFNEISVKKGDFIDVKPGVVHGTLEGSILICEIQQNSDTTYRIYDFDREVNGVKRELHLDKAMDVIEFGKDVEISSEESRKKIKIQDATVEELIRGDYFSIDRILVDGTFSDKSYKNFKIYSILDGDGVLNSEDKEYKVKKGDTYFIPAKMSVEISGKLEIMKSYI
ncbi:class I mannose-6-phosphate isomerase [Cetobacterium somerae]|uniref:type I phosphomannose isomerase catalytic subunit n=1 Tax=Cetobacterium sp. NK01 TaxID=2993530 RepID=UPI002116C07C|nr:type I phosphomannose isomerase catalytic subunit [Cetobacterium sp. NK01]MCQ8212246.1 class I mannose-6-phosphate isomerase [Cetobacterium sp. NK01]